jgi:hypothetical protein
MAGDVTGIPATFGCGVRWDEHGCTAVVINPDDYPDYPHACHLRRNHLCDHHCNCCGGTARSALAERLAARYPDDNWPQEYLT